MDRRELLRTLGAAGATVKVAAVLPPSVPTTGTPARRRAPASDLQARLTDALARHKVVGASAAVWRNGQMETAAAGVINATTGIDLTPDTVMHIGSITKVLNATLILQLVDEGLVKLDQPLKHYLPDFAVADPEATRRITVGMLLNHTSGIDGEIIPEMGHDRERIEDAIPRIAKLGQIHAPGADLSYCNSAVVLSGYLAQRLTGKSWYELIQTRIYDRLGLRDSIIVPEFALLHRASVGHFLNPATGKQTRTSFPFLPLSFAPAGATAMLSAADLATFALAHCRDGLGANGTRLLSAESALLMRKKTASYRTPAFADIGLGWMLLENGVVTHGGGGPGIVSVIYAHPASETVVSVLTNSAHGGVVGSQIAAPVLEAAAGAKPFGAAAAELAKRATDQGVDPRPYVGTYENVSVAMRVIPQGNGIAVASRTKIKFYDTTSLDEGPAVPLRPIGNGLFSLGGAVLGFVNPEANGATRHIAMGGRLFRRVG